VDFVIVRNRDLVDAIECKWDSSEFDPAGLKAFRTLYPKGNNYLVCPLTVPPYLKQLDRAVHGAAGVRATAGGCVEADWGFRN
jgi:hypothetical protein